MKTMYSLPQISDLLLRQQDEKVDYLVRPDRIYFVSGLESSEIDVLDEDDLPVAENLVLNDVAHSQFADKLKIPKRFYGRLRSEVPTLLDQNVNTLLRHGSGGHPSKWMVRTIGPVARAALSEGYARIDNYEIANMAIPILGEIPDVQFRSCAVTDTHMYLKATTPRLTESVVGQTVEAGVFIRNSEVGWGKFVICPFVMVKECENGMIVMRRGEGTMERVHVGRRAESDALGRIISEETRRAESEAFMLRCRDVIRAAVSEVRFRELVERMVRATETESIQDPRAAVEILAQREDLTDGEERGILRHLAGGSDLSLWGLASAVTRAAEDAEKYDRATELEILGGRVLHYGSRDWLAVATADAETASRGRRRRTSRPARGLEDRDLVPF